MVAKQFDSKSLIKGTVLVKDINDEDLWFESDDFDPITLPGAGRAADPLNTVARRQVRTLVRGLQRRATAANGYMDKTFADALAAERRRIGMSPRQWDTTLVNSYFADSRAENAHLPLTDGQKTILVNYLSALAGTKDFWWAPTQEKIETLDAGLKQHFTMRLLTVDNRGDFDDVLAKLSAFVGNPPAERASDARAMRMNGGATNDSAINNLVNAAQAEADDEEIDPFKV